MAEGFLIDFGSEGASGSTSNDDTVDDLLELDFANYIRKKIALFEEDGDKSAKKVKSQSTTVTDDDLHKQLSIFISDMMGVNSQDDNKSEHSESTEESSDEEEDDGDEVSSDDEVTNDLKTSVEDDESDDESEEEDSDTQSEEELEEETEDESEEETDEESEEESEDSSEEDDSSESCDEDQVSKNIASKLAPQLDALKLNNAPQSKSVTKKQQNQKEGSGVQAKENAETITNLLIKKMNVNEITGKNMTSQTVNIKQVQEVKSPPTKEKVKQVLNQETKHTYPPEALKTLRVTEPPNVQLVDKIPSSMQAKNCKSNLGNDGKQKNKEYSKASNVEVEKQMSKGQVEQNKKQTTEKSETKAKKRNEIQAATLYSMACLQPKSKNELHCTMCDSVIPIAADTPNFMKNISHHLQGAKHLKQMGLLTEKLSRPNIVENVKLLNDAQREKQNLQQRYEFMCFFCNFNGYGWNYCKSHMESENHISNKMEYGKKNASEVSSYVENNKCRHCEKAIYGPLKCFKGHISVCKVNVKPSGQVHVKQVETTKFNNQFANQRERQQKNTEVVLNSTSDKKEMKKINNVTHAKMTSTVGSVSSTMIDKKKVDNNTAPIKKKTPRTPKDGNQKQTLITDALEGKKEKKILKQLSDKNQQVDPTNTVPKKKKKKPQTPDQHQLEHIPQNAAPPRKKKTSKTTLDGGQPQVEQNSAPPKRKKKPKTSDDGNQPQVEQTVSQTAAPTKKKKKPKIPSDGSQPQVEQTVSQTAAPTKKKKKPKMSNDGIQPQVEQTMSQTAAPTKKKKKPKIPSDGSQPQVEQTVPKEKKKKKPQTPDANNQHQVEQTAPLTSVPKQKKKKKPQTPDVNNQHQVEQTAPPTSVPKEKKKKKPLTSDNDNHHQVEQIAPPTSVPKEKKKKKPLTSDIDNQHQLEQTAPPTSVPKEKKKKKPQISDVDNQHQVEQIGPPTSIPKEKKKKKPQTSDAGN